MSLERKWYNFLRYSDAAAEMSFVVLHYEDPWPVIGGCGILWLHTLVYALWAAKFATNFSDVPPALAAVTLFAIVGGLAILGLLVVMARRIRHEIRHELEAPLRNRNSVSSSGRDAEEVEMESMLDDDDAAEEAESRARLYAKNDKDGKPAVSSALYEAAINFERLLIAFGVIMLIRQELTSYYQAFVIDPDGNPLGFVNGTNFAPLGQSPTPSIEVTGIISVVLVFSVVCHVRVIGTIVLVAAIVAYVLIALALERTNATSYHAHPNYKAISGTVHLTSWLVRYLVTILAVFACGVRELYDRKRFEKHFAVEKDSIQIKAHRHQVQSLLTAMLPSKVLEDLLSGRPAIHYAESATVVFSDLVGFTAWCTDKSPRQVALFLNLITGRFDYHAKQLGVEKVKTIGDAYWAVAGLSLNAQNHAANTVTLARKILTETEDISNSGEYGSVSIRVGVHSGPVVGSIIGAQKLSYEIFGVTNQVASELESAAKPNTALISEATRSILRVEKRQELGDDVVEVILRCVQGKVLAYTLSLHNRDEVASSVGEDTAAVAMNMDDSVSQRIGATAGGGAVSALSDVLNRSEFTFGQNRGQDDRSDDEDADSNDEEGNERKTKEMNEDVNSMLPSNATPTGLFNHLLKKNHHRLVGNSSPYHVAVVGVQRLAFLLPMAVVMAITTITLLADGRLVHLNAVGVWVLGFALSCMSLITAIYLRRRWILHTVVVALTNWAGLLGLLITQESIVSHRIEYFAVIFCSLWAPAVSIPLKPAMGVGVVLVALPYCIAMVIRGEDTAYLSSLFLVIPLLVIGTITNWRYIEKTNTMERLLLRYANAIDFKRSIIQGLIRVIVPRHIARRMMEATKNVTEAEQEGKSPRRKTSNDDQDDDEKRGEELDATAFFVAVNKSRGVQHHHHRTGQHSPNGSTFGSPSQISLDQSSAGASTSPGSAAVEPLLHMLAATDSELFACTIPQACVMFIKLQFLYTSDMIQQPRQLMKKIGNLVTAIDDKLETHRTIDKIKTVGDIMLVAGPLREQHHADDATFQRAIRETIEVGLWLTGGTEQQAASCGIHVGSLIGATIGTDRLIFDVFGATVNMASRVCSVTGVNEVCVSSDTVQKLGAGGAPSDTHSQRSERSSFSSSPAAPAALDGVGIDQSMSMSGMGSSSVNPSHLPVRHPSGLLRHASLSHGSPSGAADSLSAGSGLSGNDARTRWDLSESFVADLKGVGPSRIYVVARLDGAGPSVGSRTEGSRGDRTNSEAASMEAQSLTSDPGTR